ncbi:TIGR02270 family protein [Pseudomonas frederiksbergensis]|uniref:TIGR02270 family protein n=1 Tax=Pseudomonas frederiksbergensis TaxID=104087 RepID=A0A423HIW2_9PSED|nr:TIGR02270 family protein [Pseudomonas frederiksbergensis]RON13131.1 hypothetical protein BK662_18320 [Pseudomonas frederiksbergensis]RON14253.1 hypothetical protein BK662_24375 [Pseudomonas frederiksbergensis]
MKNGFAPAEISSLLNIPVVTEHADEASFLWSTREQAALAPHYHLDQLALLDERVLAHLEGLRVAGETGLQLATQALGDLNSGTLFVAGWLAFALQNREAMSHTFSIALSDPELSDALISALSWLDWDDLEPLLQRLAESPLSAHRAVDLAVRVAQGIPARQTIIAALNDPDPQLRARALRAIGERGLTECEGALDSATADSHAGCRFWSYWSRALQGDFRAAELAFEVSEAAQQTGPALEIAARAGYPDWVRSLIRGLAGNSTTLRQAVIAAGAFGDPAVVPWLLELCGDNAFSCVAAEAFALITGLDLEDPSLRRDPLDLEDEHPDDAFAYWVSTEALHDWWQAEQGRFTPGSRYLAGRPISEAAAIRLLHGGTQRQRRGAAIELARLRKGASVFPVTARADRQQRWLAA